MRRCVLLLSLVFVHICFLPHLFAQEKTADELSVDSIRHPQPLQLSLWADSTQLANPVAFTMDHSGQMFICETFRQNQGVEDNRSHMDWLDDDLAAQSLEDRLAYFKKHLGEDIQKYEEQEDRVTRLVDSDGDGKADQYGVFADGFNDVLTGTGAGVLAYGGDVFYTCIPDVWKLSDENQDGVAEKRTSLHYGYGVRVAFRGHDLHGLVVGPDGRMYFSIGDRGYNIQTKEGKHLHDPASGAVFRCEMDGSNLEVFATGLRNPQELAFDDWGNLFTGDNNSDGGDEARLVHIIEGGETGWRMHYQYLSDRGPWNREKLWHPQHEGQAAYLLPPICNFADGPSGFVAYPGTGLGNKYKGTFFLCDFRGDAAISGIRSFQFQPQGASFEMVNPERFLWNVLATDADFGPDGAMYLTDWVEGWSGINRGRVIRVTHPQATHSKQSQRVATLLKKDFSEEKVGAIAARLGNPDRRVRSKAQFEIASRGAIWQFAKVIKDDKRPLARLHSLWGLGQIARMNGNGKKKARAANQIVPLTLDADANLRQAAIQILGDLGVANAIPAIVKSLEDVHPRVRATAGIAIGKFPEANATELLVRLLVKNDDADPVLRHAGVMGLIGTCTEDELFALKNHDQASVRRAVVLALRRLESSKLAFFLNDADSSIVSETVLAIHDLPVEEALPSLAALRGPQVWSNDAIARRVINANFRIGGSENALAIGELLGLSTLSNSAKLEVLSCLENWANPSNRDRVLGEWRPLDARPASIATNALRKTMHYLPQCSPDVAIEGIRLSTAMGIKEGGELATQMITQQQYDAAKRAALLRPLAELRPDIVTAVAMKALEDSTAEVRAAARELLVDLEPARGLAELTKAAENGSIIEQQSAFSKLALLESDESQTVLAELLSTQLLSGKLPKDVHLDAVDAAKQRGLTDAITAFLDPLKSKPYGEAHLSLHGGDVDRGRATFEGNVSLSCTRCHKAGESGGRVGPNLAGLGATKSAEYLLESILDPNKVIAEGFGTLIVVTDDGLQKQGVLQKETDEFVQLVDAEGKQFTVLKDEIIDRKDGKSAMPEDLTKDLSLFELRDLVAFLQSLKTPFVEEPRHD